MLTAASIAALAVLAACDAGGNASSVSSGISADKEILDANGHPLLLPNTDPGVAVFDAWMASPTHRARIEDERFTHTGVGYALDAHPSAEFADVHYWAMAFLKR